MSSITQSTAARLASRVAQSSGCWIWTGCIETSGYGRMSVNGKSRYVHRVAYEIEHGPLDADSEVDHICRNRACVKPCHLRAVTRGENQQNLSQLSPRTASGLRGVTWHAKTKSWRTQVKVAGVTVHESYHATLDEAAVTVVAARNKHMTHNTTDRHACL